MKKRIILLFSALLILVCSFGNIMVHAANYITMNDHKMIGGVGSYGENRRYYYIVSSAEKFENRIDTAMSDWVNTTSRLSYTTSLSFRQTTNRQNSVIDIMATSNNTTGQNGVLAWTEFYKSGDPVSPDNSNWKYNHIKLYTPNFSNLTSANRKGTIAHELGHAFGLDENNTRTDAIMCQTNHGRSATSAQICDLKGINYLYN